MPQSQFWSTPATYPGQFDPLPPSSSVHTQESDSPSGAAGWPPDLGPQRSRRRRPLFGRGTPDEWLESRLSDAAQTFRHSGWQTSRKRVDSALQLASASESRVKAFRSCGANAFLMECISEPGRFKVTSSKCKDRFCKPCARERAGVVARNLLGHVESRQLRFLTLTLKTQSPDLKLELDRLYKGFSHLRRRAFWQKHVVGGAALLEVKYNESSARWHPHLHVLVEGSYVPHTKLASEWRAVTGNSWIVDIRAVRDNSKVTRYICKYATDPIDRSIGRRGALLVQAIDAFKGRKTCLTFGTWRSVVLTESDVKVGWRQIGTLNALIERAHAGEVNALKILNALWIYEETHEKNAQDPSEHPRPPPNENLLFA